MQQALAFAFGSEFFRKQVGRAPLRKVQVVHRLLSTHFLSQSASFGEGMLIMSSPGRSVLAISLVPDAQQLFDDGAGAVVLR